MNTKLFILNTNMDCIEVLDSSLPAGCPFFNDVHTEQLEHGLMTLEFKVPASHKKAQALQNENYVVYPNMDNRYQLFKIRQVTENNSGGQYIKTVFAENAAVSDLIGNVVRPATLNSYNISQSIDYVLTGTTWRAGETYVDDVKDLKFDDYTNSLEALHKVMDVYGCELEWLVYFNGLQVIDKVVAVWPKGGRGTQTGKVFTYGIDLKEVERTEDSQELYTALVGLSNGDGYGNYLNLRNYPGPIEPGYTLEEDFLGSDEALQRFGNNGKHIVGIYRIDGLQNQTELYNKTLEKLKEVSKPRLTYKVSVALLERITGYEAHKVRLGDTILVKDTTFKPELVLEARVIEMKRSKIDPSQDSVTLGEFRPIIATPIQQLQQLQSKMLMNQSKWDDAGATVQSWKNPNDPTQVNGAKIGGTVAVGTGGNASGLVILKGNETPAGALTGSDDDGFDELIVGKLISPSVVARNTSDYTIYVDPIGGDDANDGLSSSTQKKTLQAAFNMIPKYNESTITILIKSGTGTWTEGSAVRLSGIMGSGTITIDFQSRTNTLNSRLEIFYCMTNIIVQNGSVKNQEVFQVNTWSACAYVLTSSRVTFKNMYFDARAGSKLQYCVAATFNSYIQLDGCEAYNGQKAQLVSSSGSYLETMNTGCRGSGGEYGIYVVSAAAGGQGEAPTGTLNNVQRDLGGYCNATFTHTSGTAPGAAPTQTYEYTATATSTKSWRTTYGWRTDNSDVYQGQYGSWGNHKGLAFFDYATIQSKLTNKTVKSVQLYLVRKPGGTNSAQYVNVYTHNYASQPGGEPTAITLAKSNAGKIAVSDDAWISLPTSVGDGFKNGTIKGIALYSPSGSPYVICSPTVKLKFVYEG